MKLWQTVHNWAFGGAVVFLATALLYFIVDWAELAGTDFWNRFFMFSIILCPPSFVFGLVLTDSSNPISSWEAVAFALTAAAANAAIYAVLGSIWWLIEIKEWRKR